MNGKLPLIMTIPETAAYLKLSKSKVYYLVHRNEIPYIRIGKNVRIRQKDLLNWLEEKLQPVNQGWFQ